MTHRTKPVLFALLALVAACDEPVPLVSEVAWFDLDPDGDVGGRCEPEACELDPFTADVLDERSHAPPRSRPSLRSVAPSHRAT